MEPEQVYDGAEFDWEAAKDDIAHANETITALLSPTPVSRDELIRISGLTTAIATAAFLEMELAGDIIVEADGRVAASPNF